MPTLTTNDMAVLSEAVEDIKTALTGTIDITVLNHAYTALGHVLEAVTRCENPNGKYPTELVAGDRVQIDTGEWVTVIGYPWETNLGGNTDDTITAVPVEGSVVFLPTQQKVDHA